MLSLRLFKSQIMKTTMQELLEGLKEIGYAIDKSNIEKLLENEKKEMIRAFEQGKQAQWEQDNMKKGLQPHNVSFDEYYSKRYYQGER